MSRLLPLLLLFPTAICATAPASLCNTYTPTCGLSATEATARYLTPHATLITRLKGLAQSSKIPLRVGPLIRNATNNGLLDIDQPLDRSLAPVVNVAVCLPADQTPTIRRAVVCTVTASTNHPERGNTHPALVGRSTQGRDLWAARLGTPGASRVFLVTQQHGNEAAATEAALRLLAKLTRNTALANRLLARVDLLILLRANPDGGEPSANSNPAVAVPYAETEGFFRHNVDPAAGGGFAAPTEPGFFGVVGRGYDLNRYNYAGLRDPIRPVESQALVAAVHAFRPDFLFDMHGDGPKVRCNINPATVKPNTVGPLPGVECLPPAPKVPVLSNARPSIVMGGMFADDASVLSDPKVASLQKGPAYKRNTRLTRSIVAEVVRRLDRQVTGAFTRFSQFQGGGSFSFSDGTLDRTAITLGGVGSGWEVLNFGPALRPAVNSVTFNGSTPVPAIGVDTADIEPCFLRDNICIHQLMIKRTLLATSKFAKSPRVLGDNGYCAIPLDDGIASSLPAAAGFGSLSIEGPVLTPQGGSLDGALGLPFAISGECPGDSSPLTSRCNS